MIRTNVAPDRTPHADFLDDYVATAPLTESAFAIDNATVYTIMQHLIAGNEEAESKVVLFTNTTNGRGLYLALQNHYQGTGVMATDVTSAEEVIATIFYNGESSFAVQAVHEHLVVFKLAVLRKRV